PSRLPSSVSSTRAISDGASATAGWSRLRGACALGSVSSARSSPESRARDGTVFIAAVIVIRRDEIRSARRFPGRWSQKASVASSVHALAGLHGSSDEFSSIARTAARHRYTRPARARRCVYEAFDQLLLSGFGVRRMRALVARRLDEV